MSFDFKKAAGLGTDTIDRGVLGMPFLSMIQKGSPEFDETHAKHKEKKIEGCKPGQIVFEPERRIIPAPMVVIPLAQVALYTEWKPNKGGFVGNRSLDVIGERGYRTGIPGTKTQYKEYLGDNELVYTMYFIVLFQVGSEWKKGMIAFTSTALKAARLWSRLILGAKLAGEDTQLPIFASTYKLSTVIEHKTDGSYYNWQIERDRIMDATQDQTLLEHAFTEAQSAQKTLPRAKPQAALANAGAAEDAPY